MGLCYFNKLRAQEQGAEDDAAAAEEAQPVEEVRTKIYLFLGEIVFYLCPGGRLQTAGDPVEAVRGDLPVLQVDRDGEPVRGRRRVGREEEEEAFRAVIRTTRTEQEGDDELA